jgi:hypothetical protein
MGKTSVVAEEYRSTISAAQDWGCSRMVIELRRNIFFDCDKQHPLSDAVHFYFRVIRKLVVSVNI